MEPVVKEQYWVGIDWGKQEHVVHVVDGAGRDVAHFSVKHSPQGLSALVARLRAQAGLGGIAVETHRHVLVQALLTAGLRVYSINPKVSHAWRKTWTASECKDDQLDAQVLAVGLRERHERLRPFVPDTEDARTLAMLCEDESRLIGQRTAIVQQLEDSLKQYFPAALEYFNDWTAQVAWDFILTFPTAEAFAAASKRKLIGFLKGHRLGLPPKWQERIAHRDQATAWPSDPATVRAKSLLAVALAKQLRALEPTLKDYRKRITAAFETHEDRALFQSLPGAGPKLAPRLASGFGTQRDRFESAESVQELSGAAPVTKQSGKHKTVKMRRACQKRFRNALHLFAWQSMRQCAWAHAFYVLARRRNQTHALALRNLADKWLKIIYRMWQDHAAYDDQRYVRQLIKKRSPIAYELGWLKLVENQGINHVQNP